MMDIQTSGSIVSSESALTPTIDSINVNKSTRVHIGPKFVSVTQNVQNVEVVKGRLLGLQLVSSQHNRLSCSAAVFVCWSLVVASALVVYIVHIALPKPSIIDLDIQADWYLRRLEWHAMPAYTVEFLQTPLQYVIIGHSVTDFCDERFQCIETMMMIQENDLRRGFGDIEPNFLVGGKGLVFEGRGANVFSAMVTAWNEKSITISFIGNYVTDIPDQAQFDHLNIILTSLVKHGILRRDYIVYGQCQVQPLTVRPGPQIMRRMSNFQHWDPINHTQYCLSGSDRSAL
ncbi:peptidoglycan-recognition protein SC2-like [Aricia agestis]|uniref:peptidoglycan-recognition protein SC2-like n=1 Tax=Aricia agestis TaxID=91739 RepID=UPI001C20A0B8|nr:peptidoglycan-recognition protein SC2-like [Aricia agestis]